MILKSLLCKTKKILYKLPRMQFFDVRFLSRSLAGSYQMLNLWHAHHGKK